MTRLRFLSPIAIFGFIGLLCAGLMSSAVITTTDASWSDAQTASSRFEYSASESGLPHLSDPEAIKRHFDTMDPFTSEAIEDLLVQAAPEQTRTIAETVGEYTSQPLVGHINELAGLNPSTPEGIEVAVDDLHHPDFQGTDRSFCFDATVHNSTSEEVMWEMTFDTTAAPFWGWQPFADGKANFTGDTQRDQGYWESHRWNPNTNEWTVRGTADSDGNEYWRAPDSSPIDPGTPERPESVSVRLCIENLPTPAVQHKLFTYEVSEAQGNSWYQELQVQTRTDVKTYIPWEFYVDLTQHVCPATLADPRVQISVGAHGDDPDRWAVHPVAGSTWDSGTPYVFRVARSPQAHDSLIGWHAERPTYPRWNQTFLRIQANNNAQIERPNAAGECSL